jgi:hypothetical protein
LSNISKAEAAGLTQEALTSIRACIHCTNTNESEADKVMIRQFMDVLAEMALAVASRQAG